MPERGNMAQEYYDPWSNTKTKHGLDADLVISALQKCIRRGDEATAMRMAYELYVTSTFHEEKMWNRLLVIPIEDIGFGDPMAAVIVKNLNDLRKEFAYGDGDRSIFFLYAIRYLCKCKKERSTDHIKNIIMRESEKGQVPEIPDYAIDMPFTTLHGVYTRNTLILFARDCGEQDPVFQEFLKFLSSLSISGQTAHQEIQTASFPDLAQLLPVILDKVRRYNMICYIHNFHVIATCNYSLLSAELERLASQLFGDSDQELAPLLETINNVQDLQFLKQSVSSLLLKLGSSNLGFTAADLTDFLMEINQEKSLDHLKKKVCQYFLNMKKNHEHQGSQPVSAMVLRIFQYVEEHISSPNLTLKSIAEQHLFMNTDYVSRKFQKETGEKFSSYLTSVRIRKAKEYLASSDAGKIQNVACMVGCGNNPQYFSQLFRKQTGMTPSAYVAKLHNAGT